jgi:hypothetical protein
VAPAHKKVPSYLTQSILVTIFCCLPLGIAAIVSSAQVNSKLSAGDYEGAMEASQKAKKWGWVAFFLGLAAGVIQVLVAAADA